MFTTMWEIFFTRGFFLNKGEEWVRLVANHMNTNLDELRMAHMNGVKVDKVMNDYARQRARFLINSFKQRYCGSDQLVRTLLNTTAGKAGIDMSTVTKECLGSSRKLQKENGARHMLHGVLVKTISTWRQKHAPRLSQKVMARIEKMSEAEVRV